MKQAGEELLEQPRIKKHLFYLNKFPPKEGKILDAGDGPGRYAIWLAGGEQEKARRIDHGIY